MKTVIVLGHDGYIGHALTLRLLAKGYKVIGVDNALRRSNVADMESYSATNITSMFERRNAFKRLGEFDLYYTDISNHNGYLILEDLFKRYKPSTVVNLAQMPSAPYSQRSILTARDMSVNNIASTINVLWAMKEIIPDAQLVQIGTMGEYAPDIGVDIPEGYMTMKVNNRAEKQVIFPRSGGSFYHTSKISSTYFIEYASRVYNIRATDIMQGIVYGNYTPEIAETKLHTRLDSDEAFGTVVNRFIVQTVLEEPLTVYGAGDHKRGFLALNDSVQCLMLAIENGDYDGYRVWNQLDTVHSMNEVAKLVKMAGINNGFSPEINHIESPRVENTNGFYYNPITEKLKKLGFKPTRNMLDEATYVIGVLKGKKDLNGLRSVVMPKILWRS